VIAGAIFAAELVHGHAWCFFSKFFHSPANQIPLRAAAKIQRFHTLLIFLFAQLFIEHTVLFLVLADTSETIAASEAVFAKLTLSAVLTVLGIIDHVAARAIDTLRAPLATDAEGEAAATHTLSRVTGVVHIFRIEDPEAVVAILRLHRRIRIVAVLGTDLLQVIPRFLAQ
jgi:hypothetical protein